MKLVFLGDSITQGVGASVPEKCYVSLVGQKLSCEAVNCGIGGTRIARQTKETELAPTFDQDFMSRVEKMPFDADMVFVFGGTNDYGHGDADIGEYDKKDPYTFHGATRILIENLIEKYGNEKLCFLMPLRRWDEGPVYGKGGKEKTFPGLETYVDILRDTLDKYGVEYLDFYKINLLPKPKAQAADEYTVDGLHPNDNGHEIIANAICEYIKKR